MSTTTTPQVLSTLMTFDSGNAGELRFSEPFANIPLRKLGKLTTEQYKPWGGTPLRDATARAIDTLDKSFKDRPGDIHIGFLLDASGSMMPLQQSVVDGYNEFVSSTAKVEPTGEGRVMLIIFTDGGENASREYSAQALKALTDAKEAEGWTFVYMGANQDAYATASTSGLPTKPGAYMNYSGTARGMSASYGNLTSRTSTFVGEGKHAHDVAAAAMGDTVNEDGSTGNATPSHTHAPSHTHNAFSPLPPAPTVPPVQPPKPSSYKEGTSKATDFLKGS